MAVIAPALARLRSELDKRWPGRDRRTDGWIGNAAHAATGSPENGGSDHNPNHRGIVDAFDIDKDGINTSLVIAMAIKHPAVNYVIYSRKIWSRSHGFTARRYTGSNPHTDHIHVSLLQTTAAENSAKAWGIYTGPVPAPVGGPVELSWAQRLAGALPVLRLGQTRRASVRKAQVLLDAAGYNLDDDGIYGPRTAAGVRAYQNNTRLVEDGVMGPKTWARILGKMATAKYGDKGGTVKQIQELLTVFGYTLVPDGKFGDHTRDAVTAFQHRYGLTVDGIVGPLTWTALLTR